MTEEKTFIKEKLKQLQVKKFLREELQRAGFSGADIKRTPLGTRIIINALHPGFVIGRGGENIKRLTAVIKGELGIDNPNIEVKQVEVPELDAKVMSQKIADFLERGYYFKKIVHRTLDRIMECGARGVELRICGKVPSDRAKTWIFTKGYMRHCGEVVKTGVDVGYAEAQLKTGVVGIRVRIMPPDVKFPDELLIGENIEKLVLKPLTPQVNESDKKNNGGNANGTAEGKK